MMLLVLRPVWIRKVCMVLVSDVLKVLGLLVLVSG